MGQLCISTRLENILNNLDLFIEDLQESFASSPHKLLLPLYQIIYPNKKQIAQHIHMHQRIIKNFILFHKQEKLFANQPIEKSYYKFSSEYQPNPIIFDVEQKILSIDSQQEKQPLILQQEISKILTRIQPINNSVDTNSFIDSDLEKSDQNLILYRQVLQYLKENMKNDKIDFIKHVTQEIKGIYTEKFVERVLENTQFQIKPAEQYYCSVEIKHDYMSSITLRYSQLQINEYLMMFLQDLKKIARFTRKYIQLFISFEMSNDMASLFSDENLTEFATNQIFQDKYIYNHYYIVNRINYAFLINKITQTIKEKQTNIAIKDYLPPEILSFKQYKDNYLDSAIMSFLEIKKIPSPYLKLKMLKRISKEIDTKFEDQKVVITTDIMLHILQFILIKSQFCDFVIHLKMIDYFIIESMSKGHYGSIVTNWWMSILGLIQHEQYL